MADSYNLYTKFITLLSREKAFSTMDNACFDDNRLKIIRHLFTKAYK